MKIRTVEEDYEYQMVQCIKALMNSRDVTLELFTEYTDDDEPPKDFGTWIWENRDEFMRLIDGYMFQWMDAEGWIEAVKKYT